MKKTLALILMLVMVAFAFASCGKKTADATTAAKTTAPTTAAPTGSSTTAAPTQPEATEPEETVPTCQHVPEDTWRVETPATCSAPGVEKLYCLECGEELEERQIPIDPDAHEVDEWTVTEAANMLNPTGSRTGVCTLCHNDVVEDILWEGPNIKAFEANSERYGMAEVKLEDVRGDDHFYPTDENPDGKDLYVEFSILWNETVLNFDASKNPYMVGRFYDGKPFYYFSPVPGMSGSDAQFSGAFEWMGNFATPISDSEVTTPATMCGGNPNYSDYPNIAGTDEAHPEYGWHRVGVRYHLELLDGKTGADLKDYVGIATGFVDGVAIFKLSTGADGMQNWESMLFKTEDGGESYSDAGDIVVPFIMNKSNTKADTTAYLAFSDVYVTCGTDFVMKVEKVASPEAATLEVAEGVEIPAPVYFKLAD
ncbi:MAG: hypothetical protein IKP74_04620 [Clostridia bacterium]|nr:hypothetical protein [Clostridia bacterium]